ncbi:hypothetical protein [Nocardia wallacei]|uniref:hypothetical protein n=1 Tax=Nocardia wallacei TaxID=480035 RepID=UPI002456A225|nr:hypothetical protein [Nocardia wallacei]
MTNEKTPKQAPNRRSVIVGSTAAVAGLGIGVAAAKIGDTDDPAPTTEGSFTVVDNRGKQRFLLATAKPPIILGGKTYPAQTRQGPEASYLLFNDENGNEKGGIVASGSGAQISFDYPNGDAIHLGANWEGEPAGAALTMKNMGDPNTSPEEANHPMGVRLFADTRNGTGLTLCDPQGRPRISLRVAPDGTPSIAILDEHGAIIRQL